MALAGMQHDGTAQLSCLVVRGCVRRGRCDAGNRMFVNQLFLSVILKHDSVAIKASNDARETFAADEIYVNGSSLLAELVEERVLDIDGAASGFVHDASFPLQCCIHNVSASSTPPRSAGWIH